MAPQAKSSIAKSLSNTLLKFIQFERGNQEGAEPEAGISG
jgi:hypothetical protein